MLTVTTPASNFSLVDIATMQTIITGADPAALQAYIDRASDVIARHCTRVFALETVEEIFRLDRYQTELVLARYPVAAVSSIAENGVVLTSSDYEADLTKGIVSRLYNDRSCHWSRSKIVVTYSAGYDLPDDAPQALQQGAIQLVKAYWHARSRDPALRSLDIPAVISETFLDIEHLPHDVQGLLVPFRNYRTV